ncbi:MAG: Nif3-like dinuclear metal center hexameric protein [Ginsengibacter sp.]
MKIKEIREYLEGIAPLSYQENYDNSGLILGSDHTECTGIIISLDATEAVVEEAVRKNCNLIVAHHPIIFKGIKKLNGSNYVERTIITAIKNDIAIYAIHTNLDNVSDGVNGKIAEKLHLQNCKPLLSKTETLQKLVTFSPVKDADTVRDALFKAGAGAIGKYDECSFNVEGTGTFTAGEGSHPFVGAIAENHLETEIRIEIIFPAFLQKKIIKSLIEAHPYEEVAYYLHKLENLQQGIGSGLIGELPKSLSETELLTDVKKNFGLSVIKHTPFLGEPVTKIAVCGGAGIFLLPAAMASGAQAYITSDIKYHDFFDADGRILLADIGHYESEQFTIELLSDFLQQKFPNFAVLKTEMTTNPVNYF